MKNKGLIIGALTGLVAAIIVVLFATGNMPFLNGGSTGISLPGAATKSASAPVTEVLDTFSNTSNANVEEVLGSPLYTALTEAGVNPKEVFDAFYGHISYEIDEQELPESGTGTVSVRVTNVDAARAIANYQSAFDAWKASGPDVSDEAALWQQEVAMLKSAFDDPSLETVTYDLTAEVERADDGTWRLTNEKSLLVEVLGGYSPDTLL